MNVRISKEQKIKVLNTQDIYKIMQQILLREDKIRRNQEHFWVIGLNNSNKILFIELVSLGSDNRMIVKPTEVFRIAIYKLAVKIILVHNHPSGSMTPSAEDINLTDRLLKSGQLLEIDVEDHFIISPTDYVSFAELSIMEKLRNNGAFEVVDRFKAELEGLRIERERKDAAKQAKVEMARELIKIGKVSVEEIRKITGLKVAEINKILKEVKG